MVNITFSFFLQEFGMYYSLQSFSHNVKKLFFAGYAIVKNENLSDLGFLAPFLPVLKAI